MKNERNIRLDLWLGWLERTDFTKYSQYDDAPPAQRKPTEWDRLVAERETKALIGRLMRGA
jgi:hypothetical protein